MPKDNLLFSGTKGSPYTFLRENKPRLKGYRISRIRGTGKGVWQIFGRKK